MVHFCDSKWMCQGCAFECIARARGHQWLTLDLDRQSQSMIRMDLCGYMRDRLKMHQMTYTDSPTPEYDKLCRDIFSIPLTSSFVESLFSKMTYNQSKIRSRLTDSKMSSILHLHDSALPDPQKCLPTALQLSVVIPRTLCDELTMSKHIGTRVCCVFEGERYHGEVDRVIYHDIHSQYVSCSLFWWR